MIELYMEKTNGTNLKEQFETKDALIEYVISSIRHINKVVISDKLTTDLMIIKKSYIKDTDKVRDFYILEVEIEEDIKEEEILCLVNMKDRTVICKYLLSQFYFLKLDLQQIL